MCPAGPAARSAPEPRLARASLSSIRSLSWPPAANNFSTSSSPPLKTSSISMRNIAKAWSRLREANRKLEQRNLELQRSVESERRAHEERKRAESHLIQNEKMTSLGQLAAGVAHEINNPLAFVINNITILRRDLWLFGSDAQPLPRDHGSLAVGRPELVEPIEAYAEKVDLPYTLENLDRLLERTAEGRNASSTSWRVCATSPGWMNRNSRMRT